MDIKKGPGLVILVLVALVIGLVIGYFVGQKKSIDASNQGASALSAINSTTAAKKEIAAPMNAGSFISGGAATTVSYDGKGGCMVSSYFPSAGLVSSKKGVEVSVGGKQSCQSFSGVTNKSPITVTQASLNALNKGSIGMILPKGVTSFLLTSAGGAPTPSGYWAIRMNDKDGNCLYYAIYIEDPLNPGFYTLDGFAECPASPVAPGGGANSH
jgi:hypothetical protein